MKLSAKQLGRRYERAGRPSRAALMRIRRGRREISSPFWDAWTGQNDVSATLLFGLMPTEGEVALTAGPLGNVGRTDFSASHAAHTWLCSAQRCRTCADTHHSGQHSVCRRMAQRRGLNPQAALKSSQSPWVLLIWADSIPERFPRRASSSGVCQSAHDPPELIVADEPTSNLDRAALRL